MTQSETSEIEKETRKHLENIYNHIDINAEALRQLMILMVNSMPHLDNEVIAIMSEWHRIHKEIKDEFESQQ